MSAKRMVLGIDPGTAVTGYGIVNASNKQAELTACGIIDLRKISAPNEKLKCIFKQVAALIDEYRITEFAIEAPFFGKNVQSMLKLGKSQGVAIAAALSRDIEVFEYSPRKIKMAVTGNGNASKEQVAAFLEQTFKQKISELTLDATDGLAVALCQTYRKTESTQNHAKTGSWKAFINKNPKRVIK
jgi:crossover junction endodeoxyribonuclease RuvC